jgi:hypothetical protein
MNGRKDPEPEADEDGYCTKCGERHRGKPHDMNFEKPGPVDRDPLTEAWPPFAECTSQSERTLSLDL